mgnify:CR=1 FL=1
MSRKSKRSAASTFPNWLWVILVLIAVGGVAFWFMTRPAAVGEIEGVQTFTVEQGHREGGIDYGQHPPPGGLHNSTWINCGVYDTQVQVERAVHSLEHGAVWITYEPDLASEQVEQLRTLAEGRGHVLLSPYMYVPLANPIIAVAWGVSLEVDDAGDPRLARFIQTYVNGPQTPEPGASCSGGEGRPI